MRFLGLIGLVLALLVVGLLAKKQLGAGRAAVPAVAASAQGAVDASSAATVREQSQHIQQQYQQALEGALQQQQRAMPEDAQ